MSYDPVPTGIPDLDTLIAGRESECYGYPRRFITQVFANDPALLATVAEAARTPYVVSGNDPLVNTAERAKQATRQILLVTPDPNVGHRFPYYLKQIAERFDTAVLVLTQTQHKDAPPTWKFYTGLRIELHPPTIPRLLAHTVHIHKSMISDAQGHIGKVRLP